MKLVTSGRPSKNTAIMIGHHIDALGRVGCPQIQSLQHYRTVDATLAGPRNRDLGIYSLFDVVDPEPWMPPRIRLCRTCFKKRLS